ncbi:deaminase [Mesorhizobium sp. M0663]|uniref:deoxycytidylate deaminase n=1 Tax=Mesorhizobium sp. M0663 TaxID=2956981 RepID=UPI003338649E
MAISDSDRRFLLRCEEVKEGSHDPHRKVGVVIVDQEEQTLSSGTNAPPAQLGLSLSDSHRSIASDPDWKYFMLEHAERNAINAARDNRLSLQGATMYGSLFPCADCARAIVAAGISRLVVPSPGGDPARDTKWLNHYRYAHRMLELAGVHVDMVPNDNPTKAGGTGSTGKRLSNMAGLREPSAS